MTDDHTPDLKDRESIAASIKSRTHDEITGRPILSRDKLVHGGYYKGRCGNATVARWNAEESCFFHWREKFDNIFVERIKYPLMNRKRGGTFLTRWKNCRIAGSRFRSTVTPCSPGTRMT